MKEQDKAAGRDLNGTEKSDLPDKELKVLVIKMFTQFRRTIYEQNENFNKQKILVPNRNHRDAEYNK